MCLLSQYKRLGKKFRNSFKNLNIIQLSYYLQQRQEGMNNETLEKLRYRIPEKCDYYS